MLMEAGLGAPEARTYLALYSLQEAQTGKLAEAANVHTSKIYEILERLIDKGLASYRIQNNIKVFQAAPPEALAILIEEKEHTLAKQKKKLIRAINAIKQTTSLDHPQSRYKYFEGINGIKSLWNEVADRMHNDTLHVYTGSQESYQPLVEFYTKIHEVLLQKKMPVKMLFPLTDTKLAKRRRKLHLTEIRHTHMKSQAEISVVNDFVIIQHLGREPHGFLIEDAIFAETFKEIHKKLWMNAQ